MKPLVVGCSLGLGLGLLSFIAICLMAQGYKPSTQIQTEATPQGAEYADKAPAQWPNGDSVFIDDAIKRQLRDPDSYRFDHATEFARTSVDDSAFWLSEVDFRAKNGFGGYDRGHMLVVVEDDGTDLTFQNANEIRAFFGRPKVKPTATHGKAHKH
jgi:hypothetical protein